MILVFCIVGILVLLVTLILISKLELKIDRLDISNIDKHKNNEKLSLQISLLIGKFKWFRITINKDKLARIYVKIKEKEATMDLNKVKKDIEQDFKIIFEDAELRKLIFSTKLSLEKFNANIALGSRDFLLTSYLVAVVSIVISNILPHIISPKKDVARIIHYRIVPIYKEEDIYNIHLSLTINTKILHLLNIIIKTYKITKLKKSTV